MLERHIRLVQQHQLHIEMRKAREEPPVGSSQHKGLRLAFSTQQD